MAFSSAMTSSSTYLMLLSATVAVVNAALPFNPVEMFPLNERGIPTTGRDWVTMSEGKEFQPATVEHEDPVMQRRLAATQRRFLGYKENFIDGTETYYDPRSQNWRLLGFYIDCHAEDEDDHDRKRKRQLGEGDDDHAECQRYLLWAGYIDTNYQGGGTGEYQYFDKYTQTWDTQPCTLNGNGRCAKMDCHLPETEMTLLGFFKNAGYDDWFEQLFKHEGVCVWQGDEYDFMDAYRQVWPEECTISTIKVRGNYLYYDIKPLPNAEMGIGLYYDSSCSQEYRGGKDMSSILSSNTCSSDDEDGCINLDLELDYFLEYWNAALDIFKICQPCVAYELQGGDDDHHDDRKLHKLRKRRLDEEDGVDDNVNNGYFECEDEAGYTNVNQCMKFGTHTELETASFQDVILATQQKTILAPTTIEGISAAGFARAKQYYGFPVLSFMTLMSGAVFFAWATRRRRRRRSSHHKVAEQPLV